MNEFSIHLHPALVHFPIGLFSGALIFELLSRLFKKEHWHRTAVNLYVLAALFAPVTALTGLWEDERLNLHHQIVEIHEVIGLSLAGGSLAGLVVLWLAHKRFPVFFRPIFMVLVVAAAVLAGAAGYWGGIMVYEYGIGLEQ